MKMIIKLAFRNIGRNRRRSILAIISVSLSLVLVVCMQGWITGTMNSLVKNYTKNETGHIRIATRKFEDNSKFYPVTENITDPESITSEITEDPILSKEVLSISPRVTFGVLLNNNGKNLSAIAISGDPHKEKHLLMLQQSLLSGSRYIENSKEAIIGYKLAERLGYTIGDTLKIMSSGSDYALRMKKAVIAGIYKSGINMLDENVFQIPVEFAQELLGMDNQTQQLIIMLKNWHKSDNVAAQIRAIIPDTMVTVTPWTKIGDYYRLVQMSESIYKLIYLVVAFLGAFIISNIMMMVVLERRKEIGILKSMGMTKREILSLFLCEGVIMGFIGSLFGTVIGWAIVTLLGHTGIDISSMMQSTRIPIDNVIFPHIGITGILSSLVLGTFVSALVSLLPSRQAAAMDVVEAIKSI